jgi:hypothetical protein
MKQVYFAKVNKEDYVYQVFSLACSVYTAIQKDKKVLVIDSEKFDVDHLTQSLKKYDLRVLEKKTLEFSRVAVFYGKGQYIHDLTDKVPSLFSGDCNTLGGDPCPNTVKELFFCYSLNGIEYTETYPEKVTNLLFDISASEPTHDNIWVHDYFWLDKANIVLYREIMKAIRPKIRTSHDGVRHVLHVLSEEDTSQNATLLGKSKEEYHQALVEKYIEIVGVFIQNTEDTILLIQKEPCPDLEAYLKEKGNPVLTLDTKKDESYSEVSSANGTFIGNFNMESLTGSSCSYYLHTTLPASQSILIDLDMIYEN